MLRMCLSSKLTSCVVVFLLFLTKYAHTFHKTNYSEHAIVRIREDSLHLLANEITSPKDEPEILWLDSSDKNNTLAYVRLSASHARRIRSAPIADTTLVTDDLQKWMSSRDLHASDSSESRVDALESVLVPSFFLNRYHPLSQVYGYLDEISKLDRVNVFDIGVSHEQRPIRAVEILNNPLDPHFVFIDGCTHAREWITVATAIYIIEQTIVSGVKKNFLIIPVINADGYEYTWNVDRLWRKNRRPYSTSVHLSNSVSMPDRCNGVDLNRNYDINFLGEGSSTNPCSFLYGGPAAFSEPEVRAVSELLWKLRTKIQLTISLHSFNQLWASPYAFTKEPPIHYNHHMNVLREIQSAVFNTNGVKYQIGPLSTSLYVGSGFMMDWIYSNLGIINSYLCELRDRGTHGFILPIDQILPTATETWNGVLAAINKIFI